MKPHYEITQSQGPRQVLIGKTRTLKAAKEHMALSDKAMPYFYRYIWRVNGNARTRVCTNQDHKLQEENRIAKS